MATLTLPGADIRGYYQRLETELSERPRLEAAIRCFADPNAHRREDRDPSCSVNLMSGAWQCHGCGARGGAYDAAIARGHTPRTAIDLMIAHGLIERRAGLRTAGELLCDPDGPRRMGPHPPAHGRAREEPTTHVAPQVIERDVSRWHTALSRRPSLIARLARERGWRYDAIRELELELGLELGRVTIPIRNAPGQLRGVLRYQLDHSDRPKMLAVPGSRIGLVPHPAAEASERILLVEGPPDMIAARSRDLPAIAVPGNHAWRAKWASALVGRQITVVMDSDPAGRAAAGRIAESLSGHAEVQTVDLAPHRTDGDDLTDWLLEHPNLAGRALNDRLPEPSSLSSTEVRWK
jgi:hypothetical protein